jgi:hypothetical protein
MEEMDPHISQKISKIGSASLKRRLFYLAKLNSERNNLKLNYFIREYNELRSIYDKKNEKLFEEIGRIVKGDFQNQALSLEDLKKYKIKTLYKNEDIEGIPDFWYKVLKNSEYFTLNNKDKEILNFLSDVRIKCDENANSSFSIEFCFKDNDFFHNNILVNTYVYNESSKEFSRLIGTSISWKSLEKNPGIMIINKKIKKGQKDELKTTEYLVNSFFDFFVSQKKEQLNLEVANFIRYDLIPNSLFYYLGKRHSNYFKIERGKGTDLKMKKNRKTNI